MNLVGREHGLDVYLDTAQNTEFFRIAVSALAEITGQKSEIDSQELFIRSYIFFQLDSSGGGALFPAEILAGHAGSRTPVR